MEDDDRKLQKLELLYNSLAPVREYLDDPEVQEVMINGPNDVFIERKGMMHKVEVPMADRNIRSAIQILSNIALKETKENTEACILNEEFPGVRVAATLPPVTSVATMALRKHSSVTLSLEDFLASGFITTETHDFIVQAVKNHKNIIIAGGTSSGKTTFFNGLLSVVDPEERIFTIEDVRELRIRNDNWVAFKTNKQLGISARACVEHALRYRPDRILLGEVRDGVAYDLLTAANTGHDGVIATIHANSAAEALSRLEILCMQAGGGIPHSAIKEMIAMTFHYILHMERRVGVRKLYEILEVTGFDSTTGQYQTNHILRE